MATYLELFDLQSNSDLQDKCTVAVVVAAQAVLTETPPDAARAEWAADVMSNPANAGRQALRAVLAANKNLSVAQITGAADTAFQTNVNALVDSFVLGHSSSQGGG